MFRFRYEKKWEGGVVLVNLWIFSVLKIIKNNHGNYLVVFLFHYLFVRVQWELRFIYWQFSHIYIVFITSVKIKTRVSGVRVWWTFVTLVLRYQILPSKPQWMIHWQIQRRCLSNNWNRSLAWPDHRVGTAYRTGRWGTDAGPWLTGSVTPRVRTSVNTKHQIGKHRYISIENTGIFINNEFKK